MGEGEGARGVTLGVQDLRVTLLEATAILTRLADPPTVFRAVNFCFFTIGDPGSGVAEDGRKERDSGEGDREGAREGERQLARGDILAPNEFNGDVQFACDLDSWRGPG